MTLVARSPDLSRLVDDGYDLEVRDGNLLVHHVPYLNQAGDVAFCILVSELTTNGEQTTTPGRHEVWVVGDIPHDHQGNEISILADRNRLDYGGGLVASCRLSGKPHGRSPRDYYEKISNYVRILGDWARVKDPSATHTDHPPRAVSEEESVFCFHDAATSRSGLSGVSARLALGKVAIVGLGGTGSYILDLVAKTPVRQIHLFDDDILLAHNAFRAPGAARLSELAKSPRKVDYFAEMYGFMRRYIEPHPVRIGADNVAELQDMTFVFLAIDASPAKGDIVQALKSWQTPFVDSGMSVQRVGDALRGTVRVTTGLPGHYNHLDQRISFTDVNADEYDWNIQTADLNALNAAMAVLKWKKLCGFYADSARELHSQYALARNKIFNEERSNDATNGPVQA
jgi:hypothetical protein